MTDQENKAPAHRNRVQQSPVPVITQPADRETIAAFRKVAATSAGKKVFQWLMNYCGYKDSSLTMTPQGVLLTDAIIHNEAKRAVYLDARKLLTPVLLNDIEMEQEHESKKP